MNIRDQEIGKKIKLFRKGKMTQKELAQKIDKTESSIRKYEKGLVTIPLNVLEEIASALNVNCVDLMGFEYWDLKDPNQIRGIKEQLEFDSYLRSIGFAVKDEVIEWHWEDANETDPAKQVKVADKVEYTLTKNGNSVTFTEEEFEKLSFIAREAVEGQFYTKVIQQRQKKKEK